MHRGLAVVVDGVDVGAERSAPPAGPRAPRSRCRRPRRANASRGRRPPSAACCCRRSAASGSAPSAASVVISSASAVSAASKNGVAPISFRRVLFRFTLLRHPRVHVRAVRDELLHELEAGHRCRSRRRRRIVVADAGLADRRDRVQRGVAGQVGVRIGAGVEQRRRPARNARSSPPEQRRSRPPAAAGRHSRADGRRRPGSVSFTSAPAFSRTRTTSSRPSRTAKSSGVKPEADARERPRRRR